jgi:chemotaxis protein CheX
MPSATIGAHTAAETLPIDYLAGHMSHSVGEVFSTMLGLEVRAEAPHVRSAVDVQADGVVAIVGLTGDWIGTGVLNCTADSACWISGRFLMSDYEEVNDDVLDAAGEITNMVIGGFKNALADRTGPLGMSIPAIVYGREMRTSSKGGFKDWCAFPFTCEGKAFEFLIRLQPVTPRG